MTSSVAASWLAACDGSNCVTPRPACRLARAAPASRASSLAPAPACTDIDSAGDGLRAFELRRHSGDQEREIVNAPKGLHICLARDMYCTLREYPSLCSLGIGDPGRGQTGERRPSS